MNDIQLKKPYNIRVVRADGVAVSDTHYGESEAMAAFKDMATAFQAARPAAGANVSMVGPDTKSSAAVVSEGFGTFSKKFGDESRRQAFDQLQASPQAAREGLLSARDQQELRGIPMKTQRHSVMVNSLQDGAEIVRADRSRVAFASAQEIELYARENSLSSAERDTLLSYDRSAERGRVPGSVSESRDGGERSESLASDASTATVDRGGKAVEVRSRDGHVERLSTAEQIAQFAAENEMSGVDRAKLMKLDENALRGVTPDKADAREVADKKEKVGAGVEDEDPLKKRFLRTDQGYLDKSTHVLAIEDKGTKLRTDREDSYVVESMAAAAKSRGWLEVTVSGTAAFRREAWFQLTLKDLAVHGYSPSRDDFQRLEAFKADRAAGKGAGARSDATVPAGAADLPRDKRQVANTVEKLASQAGVSGEALSRARNEITRVAAAAKAVAPVKVVDKSLRPPQSVVTPPRPKTRDFQR